MIKDGDNFLKQLETDKRIRDCARHFLTNSRFYTPVRTYPGDFHPDSETLLQRLGVSNPDDWYWDDKITQGRN